MDSNPERELADRMRVLTDRIVRGYVLDEQGNWIPIEQRQKVEGEVLGNLMAGRILHEGRWLDFEAVKSLQSSKPEAEIPTKEEEETREFKR